NTLSPSWHSVRSSSSFEPYREYRALMPTPAALATAVIGAPGSATNTARAADMMRSSLRAASALRPLRGLGVCEGVIASTYYPEQNIPFWKCASLWNRRFRSVRSVGGCDEQHNADHADQGLPGPPPV